MPETVAIPSIRVAVLMLLFLSVGALINELIKMYLPRFDTWVHRAIRRCMPARPRPPARLTLGARLVRLIFGKIGSRSLDRPDQITMRISLEEVLEQFREDPARLGWRVRLVLALLGIRYFAAGGAVWSWRTPVVLLLAFLVGPSEAPASLVEPYPAPEGPGKPAAQVALGCASFLLGAWALVEVAFASTWSDRSFWLGWIAHAVILHRVYRLGLNHGSRRWSVIGWLLVGVGQVESIQLTGRLQVLLALLTVISVGFVIVQAIRERPAE